MIHKKCIFTIVSCNYLAQANVFSQTVRETHPEHDIYVVISDSSTERLPDDIQKTQVIRADSIGIPDFNGMSIRYDATEFNTSIKPFVFGFLLEKHAYDEICYVDPDTYFMSEMVELGELHREGYSIILTPHTTSPIEDGLRPNDFDMAKAGIFNLGFCSISNSVEARKFIGWWCRKLALDCRIAIGEGIFVDQKWCDAVPALFPSSYVLTHPGYNIGYWNLMHRPVKFTEKCGWKIGEKSVRFFHFSGLPMTESPMLSKHQDRIRIAALSDPLRQLLVHYRMKLIQSGFFDFTSMRHAPGLLGSLGSATLLRLVGDRIRSDRKLSACCSNPDELAAWLVHGTELARERVGGSNCLPNALLLIYESRDDLKSALHAFENSDDQFEMALANWASSNIEKEYPGKLSGLIKAIVDFVFLPDDDFESGATDDHAKPKVGFGRFDKAYRYGIARQCIPTLRCSDQKYAVPYFLQFLLRSRPDVLGDGSWGNRQTRKRVLEWAQRHFVDEYGCPDIMKAFVEPLQRDGVEWDPLVLNPDHGSGTRLPDLKAPQWGREDGREFNLFDDDMRSGNDDLWKPAQGALLVGYPKAEMGMGEHIRNTALALSEHDYSFSVFNFDSGLTCRQNDRTLDSMIVDIAARAVQLLHINADQTIRLNEIFGRDFMAQADYVIGFWAWELERFPVEWEDAIAAVHEIWVPSKFTASALRKMTSKPVFSMPLTVEAGEVSPYDLSRRGISNDSFKFLFTFDLSSFSARKNPWAAVEAFQTAFPEHSTTNSVSLILKTIGEARDDDFRRLESIAEADARICVIHETLDKGCFNGLLNSCDAYISLHRSEGFGRGMAEAMYFGKPVIATAYSGNMDFMNDDNSWLVDYVLTPISDGEYLYGAGVEWAEPNVIHAAELMRHVHSGDTEVTKKAESGRELIRKQFSRLQVGEKYINRLKAIEEELLT